MVVPVMRKSGDYSP